MSLMLCSPSPQDLKGFIRPEGLYKTLRDIRPEELYKTLRDIRPEGLYKTLRDIRPEELRDIRLRNKETTIQFTKEISHNILSQIYMTFFLTFNLYF